MRGARNRPRTPYATVLRICVAAALLLHAARAFAQPASGGGANPPPAATPEQRMRLLEQRLDAAERYVRALRGELQSVKEAAGIASEGPPPTPGPQPQPQPTPGATPEAPQPPQIAQTPRPPEAPPLPEEESTPEVVEEEPDFTPAFLREARAVLIRRGTFEIDPRFRYTHTDRGLIAARGLDILESVFIGQLLIGSVDRDVLGPSVSFRYGLADRLQINASVPYRFQYNEDFIPFQIVRLQPGEGGGIEVESGLTSKTENHGLGDVEVGLSYHLLRERPFLPDTILTLGFKTATGDGPFDVEPGESSTGTGYLGLRGGLTFVRVSDPAVLFANVGYFLHLEDESDVPGTGSVLVDPADSIDLGLGFSYALNPLLSFTTSLNTRFVSELEIEGTPLEGTDQITADLSFDLTYAFSPHQALDVAFTLGLTDDSTDFGVGVSIPFHFRTPLPKWEIGPLRKIFSF